jgi:hypothetical protein
MAVEKVGVCFRVDRVLHAQLTAEARRAERSLARELTWRLPPHPGPATLLESAKSVQKTTFCSTCIL